MGIAAVRDFLAAYAPDLAVQELDADTSTVANAAAAHSVQLGQIAKTLHPVGGVCPFGLRTAMPVYCDLALRDFETVLPAASATHIAVLVGAEWVDVCQSVT